MEKDTVSLLRLALIQTASLGKALFPENHLLVVSRFRVSSPKIPRAFDGARILQLSDLHGTRFGRHNARLLRKVTAENPDYIFITGDMVSRTDRDHTPFFEVAQELGRRFPCYYIAGNHELDMPPARLNAFYGRLSSCGVSVVNNQTVRLRKNGGQILLSGLCVPLACYPEAKHVTRHCKFTMEEMDRSLGKPDSGGYRILLAHTPLSFEVYARWGADLAFSGHVHGGMIRLPFAGGLLSPDRRFFPKYSAGVYERDGCRMIVSRGLGSGFFGARILNPPEIVAVTLSSGPEWAGKESEFTRHRKDVHL